jgi:hypothetical protein
MPNGNRPETLRIGFIRKVACQRQRSSMSTTVCQAGFSEDTEH